MGAVFDILHKRQQLSNVISILQRAILVVKEAENAYKIGLSNGEEIGSLVRHLGERLAIASSLRDNALTEAGILEAKFPYYIDVNKIPQVYDDVPTLTATDGGAADDLLTINDHPDILEVFGTVGWGLLLVHDEDERDHVIVDETVHTKSGSSPNVDSVLALDTGTLDKTAVTVTDVVITLEDIP